MYVCVCVGECKREVYGIRRVSKEARAAESAMM